MHEPLFGGAVEKQKQILRSAQDDTSFMTDRA
jgi:hypothetical protein